MPPSGFGVDDILIECHEFYFNAPLSYYKCWALGPASFTVQRSAFKMFENDKKVCANDTVKQTMPPMPYNIKHGNGDYMLYIYAVGISVYRCYCKYMYFRHFDPNQGF